MNIRKPLLSLALLAMAALSSSSFAGPPAKVADLAWMTGNWAGNLGPNQLEENWIMGEAGSIAAMVRMTGEGATSMFEMITIEEVDGSSDAAYPAVGSRHGGPYRGSAGNGAGEQSTRNSVKFKATSEGGMASLGYSHPDAETFIIHVENPGRPVFDIT